MQDCKEPDILTVTTTVGSRADAQRLARELVQRRLAACVQVEDGLVAFYHWKGELCEDAELRLVIKTVPGCEAALQAFFREHHPYELPQFTALRMRASDAYAQWVRAEVQLNARPAAGDPPPV
jgi:periplasmic divalent cation tolerance protein